MWLLLLLILASVGLQVLACVDQEHNRCDPQCTEPCVNGSCVSPGECQCSTGYQFLNGSLTECEPICSEDCGANSRCTAPGKCTCNEGFIFNSTFNECKPLCSRSCFNGTCSGPNKCTCMDGYAELLWFLCVPLCPKSCVHGHCVAPNECRCFSGYQPSPSQGSSICEPICSHDCEHGRCIAPEICLCDEGYAKWSAGGSCELRKGTDTISEFKPLPSSSNDTSEEPKTEVNSQL